MSRIPLCDTVERKFERTGIESDRQLSKIRHRQEIGAFMGARIGLAGTFMDQISCGIERLQISRLHGRRVRAQLAEGACFHKK